MRVRKKKKTGSGQSWTFIIRQSEQQKENVLQVIWGSHVRYRDASAFLMSKASASFSLFFPRTVDSFPPSLILFLVSCFFPLSLVSHFLSVAAAKKKKKKPLPHIFAFIWRGDGGVPRLSSKLKASLLICCSINFMPNSFIPSVL